MAQEKVYAVPNLPTPVPVIFNEKLCTGCNECMEVCMIDVFIPNPEKGKPPIILHPDECFYAGCCVLACPIPGAIKLNWPLQQRSHWKRKATGERFQIEGKPPPP